MKLKLIQTHNVLIAFLLSILGFGTACEIIFPKAEYGVPHAKFKVFGKVTSENGSNIPAIKVVMVSLDSNHSSDSCLTDSYGNYEVIDIDFPNDKNYLLKFEDIDGIVLGSYKSKDTIVKFIDPQFENGDRWYEGEASKEMNIKLNKEAEL